MTGKRHSLEFINVFDDNGCINANGTGPFAGQPRFKVGVVGEMWGVERRAVGLQQGRQSVRHSVVL